MNTLVDYLCGNGHILFPVYIFLINLAGFVLCLLDKIYAVRKMPRIRERTLLVVSFVGGASGMFLGMIIFRHKTRKSKFIISVPLFILLHLILILILEERLSFLTRLFL